MIEVGQLLYGFTDHCHLITMRVKDIVDCDNDIKIYSTELVHPGTSWSRSIHKIYFREVMSSKGELRAQVYRDKERAISVLKNILDEKISHAERDLEALRKRRREYES